MNSRKVFGSREWWKERLELITSFCEGADITYNGEVVLNPTFRNSADKYKVVVPPIVDWDVVHPSFNYLAKDASGSWYLYKSKPKIKDSQWYSKYCCESPTCLKSFNPPIVDWKNSLHKRPSK